MSLKNRIMFTTCLYILFASILCWASWKIAIGVFLFTWATNLERRLG